MPANRDSKAARIAHHCPDRTLGLLLFILDFTRWLGDDRRPRGLWAGRLRCFERTDGQHVGEEETRTLEWLTFTDPGKELSDFYVGISLPNVCSIDGRNVA